MLKYSSPILHVMRWRKITGCDWFQGENDLNNEEIRVLKKEEARYEIDLNNPVKDGDKLSIIPPIAGGIGQ